MLPIDFNKTPLNYLPKDFGAVNSASSSSSFTVTMVLKRKRSDSEISTSSSLLSSPQSVSNFMMIDSFTSPIKTPSLLHSRTRKRHRDNRPSESDVHQRTLSLLLSAQQNPQPEVHSFHSSHTPVSSIPSTNQQSRQSSLHSFWAIPSQRALSPSSDSSTSSNTPPATTAMNSFFKASHCEDCVTPLSDDGSGDSMDVDMMMDVDTNGANYGCTNCGKQVCHSCAVSNLGAQRMCLNCAGKSKVWVGGLGWMDQI